VAIGIYAYNKINVKVKNGSIKKFLCAVMFDQDDQHGATFSSGHSIIKVKALKNYAVGFWLKGDNCKVQKCQITKTGKSSLVGPCYGANMGIVLLEGANCKIQKNIIKSIYNPNEDLSTGIYIGANCTGAIVGNNQIQNSDLGLVFVEISGASGEFKKIQPAKQ